MIIREMEVLDLRFPTSRTQDGTDAMHPDPDYSAAYVILKTDEGLRGHGLTFTIGRGNDICAMAIQSFEHLVVGQKLADITADMAGFWRRLAGDWKPDNLGAICTREASLEELPPVFEGMLAGGALGRTLVRIQPAG